MCDGYTYDGDRGLLKEAAVFEVVFDNDVGDCVEDELYVVGVSGAGEMRVYLFLVLAPVQILEFHLNVRCCVVVSVGTFVFWETY